MGDSKLDIIRKIIKTDGLRLKEDEKDTLFSIANDPSKYDGFVSKVFTRKDSGKDYRGPWDSESKYQYKIRTSPKLQIDKRFMHECDGVKQDKHWDWDNPWQITDVREIIKILREIFSTYE
jgi:hypothetical protein